MFVIFASDNLNNKDTNQIESNLNDNQIELPSASDSKNQKSFKEALKFFDNEKHLYNFINSEKKHLSDFITQRINKKFLPEKKEQKYMYLFHKMRRIYKEIDKLEKEEQKSNGKTLYIDHFVIERPNLEINFSENLQTNEDEQKSENRQSKIEELMEEAARYRSILQKLIFFNRQEDEPITIKLQKFIDQLDD